MEIIATPGYLKIGDQTIPLDERIEERIKFEVGTYEKRYGPKEFFWERAQELAREKGIKYDGITIAGPSPGYLYFLRELTPEENQEIPVSEVEASLPEYVRFLRIIPRPEREWQDPEVLKPLEERINALGLAGLRAFVSTSPSNSERNPTDTLTGVELALRADYRIKVEY